MGSTDGPPIDDPTHRLARVVWGLLALGVLLRVVRYAMNFPLWSDEAFVAANFITKGYLDLIRPLDYGQICPVLFLWAERAAVSLFGFSEWSLRLFPLVCGLASLMLFRRAAGGVTGGLGLVLAVGVFAVSAPPNRYASEVKPYASDLLAALALLTPAVLWLNSRGRTGLLWALAALARGADALAPGGVRGGGAGARARSGRLEDPPAPAWVPFLAFNVATAASFLALYALVMRPQDAAMPEALRRYWVGEFPPTSGVLALAGWLLKVHTGKMLGYPAAARARARRRSCWCWPARWRSGGKASAGAGGPSRPVRADARRRGSAQIPLRRRGATHAVRRAGRLRPRGSAPGAHRGDPPPGLPARCGAGGGRGAVRGGFRLARAVRRAPYIAFYDVKARDFARHFCANSAQRRGRLPDPRLRRLRAKAAQPLRGVLPLQPDDLFPRRGGQGQRPALGGRFRDTPSALRALSRHAAG